MESKSGDGEPQVMVSRGSYRFAALFDSPLIYLGFALLELLLFSFALIPLFRLLGSDPDPVVAGSETAMMLVLMQTAHLASVRRSDGFLLFLAGNMLLEDESWLYRRRCFTSHLMGLRRLGNDMSGGVFFSLVVIELQRRGAKLQAPFFYGQIVSCIDLATADQAIDDEDNKGLGPYREYFGSVSRLMASDTLRAKELRDFVVDRYLSAPAEVRERVDSRKTPDSLVGRLESHIELTRLVMWIVGLLIVISLAVMGIGVALP